MTHSRLSVHRRFQFCCAHPDTRDKKSLKGFNYTLFVSMTGNINPNTGMIINLSTLQKEIWERVLKNYDHLSHSFSSSGALLESIYTDLSEIYTSQPKVYDCTLRSSENIRWIFGPKTLTEIEIDLSSKSSLETMLIPGPPSLFDKAILYFSGLQSGASSEGYTALKALNDAVMKEIPELGMLEEILLHVLTHHIRRCFSLCQTLSRIKLYLTSNLYIEFNFETDRVRIGNHIQLPSLHQLSSTENSEKENQNNVDVCTHLHGHLFTYDVSYTLSSFEVAIRQLGHYYKHIESVISDISIQGFIPENPIFSGQSPTCETLVQILLKHIQNELPELNINELHMKETPNNQFSLKLL